jgi:putative ABC transport system permease protein
MKEIFNTRALWIDFKLARRNIARQRRRSAIAIGAIMFGVASLILMSGFVEWIFWGMREATIKTQLGHIQLVRPGYHDGGKADPYAFLLPDVVPDLEATSEGQIKVLVPRLSFGGLISHEESTISFIGEGIGPQEQEEFDDALQILAGQNLSDNDPSGIVIGHGLARNLGVNVGDQVVLLATTESRGINAVEVTVRGLFSTVTKSYDDTALRMPIETARRLLRTRGSHVWMVLLNDTANTDAMLAKWRRELQNQDIEVVPWYELADFYNQTVTLFTKQIEGVRLILAIIILLSITNTMTTSVMERTGEIGTSMALGVKRRRILRLFVSEGFLIGCLGSVAGLLLGLLSAHLISSIGIPMPPPPGMARGYTGQILVTQEIALESLLLGVATALAASLYPAWRASRLQVVDALRHNR